MCKSARLPAAGPVATGKVVPAKAIVAADGDLSASKGSGCVGACMSVLCMCKCACVIPAAGPVPTGRVVPAKAMVAADGDLSASKGMNSRARSVCETMASSSALCSPISSTLRSDQPLCDGVSV